MRTAELGAGGTCAAGGDVLASPGVSAAIDTHVRVMFPRPR